MKKRLIALLLAAMMMTTFVYAKEYTKQEKMADALNELGLFLGTGTSYELENKLTRAQGVTLLVRMMGKEETAGASTFMTPFTDVADWAKGYVGYAYTNGITNGMSATTFGSDVELNDYMFLTLVLRALGHSDSGVNATFVWDDPYALAKEAGLIDVAVADNDFTRGDAVQIFWNALSAQLVGQDITLAKSLIEQEVFTAKDYADAQEIQKNGRKENVGVPVIPSKPDDSDDDNSGNSGNAGSSGAETEPTASYTYEEYNALSGEEQQKYFNSFANPADFFTWYNAAKAEYEASQDKIEIGDDGVIDLGDILNKQP